jgi:hypothetical protein
LTHTANERHADYLFSEWMKGGKLLGLDVEKTTSFYYMVNRRFPTPRKSGAIWATS